MRVVFIARQPQQHSIYPRVSHLLSARGVDVETIAVDRAMFRMSDVAASADLYVLRTRTLPAFSAASALAAAGARFLIPLDRERVVRNRFLTHLTLVEAGIPAPRGWIAGSADALAAIVGDYGPIVIKPADVAATKGVRTIASVAEVPDGLRGPVFAQEVVPHTSADIKLYGIGARVRAIRRVFPASTIEEKEGTEIEPTAEMLALAGRCRNAFALPLYGIDLLETPRGLVVVDVNSTPGYKGVAGAAESVAELICETVAEAA